MQRYRVQRVKSYLCKADAEDYGCVVQSIEFSDSVNIDEDVLKREAKQNGYAVTPGISPAKVRKTVN